MHSRFYQSSHCLLPSAFLGWCLLCQQDLHQQQLVLLLHHRHHYSQEQNLQPVQAVTPQPPQSAEVACCLDRGSEENESQRVEYVLEQVGGSVAVVLVDGCVAAAALALLLHGRTGEEEEGAACCYSSSLVQPQAERVRHIYCFLQTQQTYEYRAVGCLFCRSSFIVACSLHNNIYLAQHLSPHPVSVLINLGCP